MFTYVILNQYYTIVVPVLAQNIHCLEITLVITFLSEHQRSSHVHTCALWIMAHHKYRHRSITITLQRNYLCMVQ